jgi:hypothetical protein
MRTPRVIDAGVGEHGQRRLTSALLAVADPDILSGAGSNA